MPSEKHHHFKISGSGTIEIKSTDEHYYKNGTYFVTVVADPVFFDLILDSHYSFSL